MTHTACAAVTYRAPAGDRDFAMQLAIAPDRATLADAWDAADRGLRRRSIRAPSRSRSARPGRPGGAPVRLRPVLRAGGRMSGASTHLLEILNAPRRRITPSAGEILKPKAT